MNDLTCTLRVTTGADRAIAKVAVRRHQFVVGRPLEFDGEAQRVGAVEYALGAVGAEAVNGLRDFAWRRRVRLDEIEALVTGEVTDSLGYLEVIGVEGTPRLARIHVKVFVAAPDREAVRAVWADALDRLPLVNTLRPAVRVEIELSVTD